MVLASVAIMFGALSLFLVLIGLIGYLIYETSAEGWTLQPFQLLERPTAWAEPHPRGGALDLSPPVWRCRRVHGRVRPRRRGGRGPERGRREPGTETVALSAIVPLFRDRSDVVEVYEAYKAALESLGRRYELIYVLSRQSERALADLKALKQRGEDTLVLVMGQQVDEAEALLNGFEQRARRGRPDPAGRPSGRAGRHSEGRPGASSAARSRSAGGRRPARRCSGSAPRSTTRSSCCSGTASPIWCAGCAPGAEPVTEEIRLHGVQPHFLPLLASERGFRSARSTCGRDQRARRRQAHAARPDQRRARHPGPLPGAEVHQEAAAASSA